MNAISVYGYELSMLSKVETPILEEERKSDRTMSPPNHDKTSDRCRLLQLPLELREQIYRDLLPTTTSTPKDIAWLRGNITILAANSQIYSEALPLMYSNATFVIDVAWDCITFAYQWLLPSGLIPSERMPFPLSPRHLPLTRRFRIRIHHVDSYTGMVKYNYSGRGLTNGLKDQVSTLCTVLSSLPEIHTLHIHLQDDNPPTTSATSTDHLLTPFLTLHNTRTVSLSSSPPSLASSRPIFTTLSTRLQNSYHKTSLLRLPPELRAMIFHYLLISELPWPRQSRRENGMVSWAYSMGYVHPRGNTAILRTCRRIYEEAARVLYSYDYIWYNATKGKFETLRGEAHYESWGVGKGIFRD
ncbi:hypothetical protein MMC20_005793 [Loxospora ochrophaea]|nr:hypothetical protein [Loxospora ochrophaea]